MAEVASGKFIVRIPKSLHVRLGYLAQAEGVSLNHLVICMLSGCVGTYRVSLIENPNAAPKEAQNG